MIHLYVCTSDIVQRANKIITLCGTREPLRIARELDIEILEYPFQKQRGAYKVINRQRFIFLNENLNPTMKNIVLLHEIGHDSLHRDEATKIGGFKEFNIFDMRDNRMEYEANMFAAEIALPDEDVYYIELVAPQEIRLQRNASENRLKHKASKRDLEASRQRLLRDDAIRDTPYGEKHGICSHCGGKLGILGGCPRCRQKRKYS